MITVTGSGECSNAPKSQFIEDLSIAIAIVDTAQILNAATEEIVWRIVGERWIQGKQGLTEALEQMSTDRLSEVRILHVASHGRAGALNGVLTFADGKTRDFCHMFIFGSLKGTSVKEITTYQIETS